METPNKYIMKSHLLYRKAHYWGSLIIALPTLIMITTGILLLVKKEFQWIQPPSQKGISQDAVPTQTFEQLFLQVQLTPQMEVEKWTDLQRVEVKPGKGVVKFISTNYWELQLDTHTGAALSLAKRRSGIIESIHDGSWFTRWMKLWVFLPVGLLLVGLWLTGIYLFFLPILRKKRKRITLNPHTI